MRNKAYITRLGKFLPNLPVTNEEIESLFGIINSTPSKARRIVLRSNGINSRYYSLQSDGNISHTNAQLVAEAIRDICNDSFLITDIEALACGTSSPDFTLPSLASSVHGEIKGRPIEIFSQSGACCSGMHALKFGYLSVISGNTQNAVVSGSELVSPLFKASNFEPELEKLKELEEHPVIAFEKEFLRWMLSDGAGVALIQNKPNQAGISLKINWIESVSYAHELETCMYAGAEKRTNGTLKSWKEFSPQSFSERGVMAMKQDVRLLEKNIAQVGAMELAKVLEKHKLNINEIDYLLPHISSEYFRPKVADALYHFKVGVPQEKWFTNLTTIGNVGSASIYLMLEALFYSGTLKKGEKILCLVPESARFSYAFSLLTVC